MFILRRELIGRVQTAYAASRNRHKATNRYRPVSHVRAERKTRGGAAIALFGPLNQLATTIRLQDLAGILRIMGVVQDLISNQCTLFFKLDTGRTCGIGGRHNIQVKLAGITGSKGTTWSTKRQHYRPLDRARETNALTVVPSP